MDEVVVNRARAGERAAMEALLASVAPSIRRFALRMCRNDADADDVLQEALLSIASNLDRFEGRSSMPSWAFALTRSACARRRRGKKNQAAEGDEVLGNRPADAPDPEDDAVSMETRSIVARALDALPNDYREVLLLRDAEGLTAPEAALALGISVDALKSRLHRARAALRDSLRPLLEVELPAAQASCPDVIGALSRKLEDELDDDACAAMERHVAGCPACARTCDTLKEALRACRAAAPAPVTPEIQARVKIALERWLAAR